MYLVYKENRLPAELQSFFRCSNHFPNTRDSFRDCRERDELAIGVVGDQASDSCFARARGSPENHRRYCPALDCLAKRLPWIKQLMLANELIESSRADTRSERLRRCRRGKE
jgi:hypothetical protein